MPLPCQPSPTNHAGPSRPLARDDGTRRPGSLPATEPSRILPSADKPSHRAPDPPRLTYRAYPAQRDVPSPSLPPRHASTSPHIPGDTPLPCHALPTGRLPSAARSPTRLSSATPATRLAVSRRDNTHLTDSTHQSASPPAGRQAKPDHADAPAPAQPDRPDQAASAQARRHTAPCLTDRPAHSHTPPGRQTDTGPVMPSRRAIPRNLQARPTDPIRPPPDLTATDRPRHPASSLFRRAVPALSRPGPPDEPRPSASPHQPTISSPVNTQAPLLSLGYLRPTMS